MKLTWRHVASIVGAWLASVAVFAYAGSDLGLSITGIAFLLFIVPVLFAGFIDWVQARPVADGHSPLGRAWRLACAAPVLVFGIASIAIGVAIVGWVLFNHLIERQPEYTGGSVWISFGIGPMAVAFGVGVIRSSLEREPVVEED